MLTQIHIRDLATIEDQHLHLQAHTTMITGETGAGKSIFIEAIELALGARGSAQLIRPGKERADISLCFDITHLPTVNAWLKQADMYDNDGECIIRRVLTSDGRSRSYINGLPATLQLVKELAELLFQLHGQSEQQTLLDVENQRILLDRYAEHLTLANQVADLSAEWRRIDREIHGRQERSQERTERRDYLRFQLEEMTTLNLQPNEWENLEAEHHRLTHSEEFLRLLQRTLSLLADDDNHNAITLLNDIRKLLETTQHLDPRANEWLNTLNASLIQLADLENELRSHIEKDDLDPERLHFVENRTSLIFDIARKHKVTPDELLALQERLQDELNTLEASDTEISALQAEQQAVASKYQELAERLSKSRLQAAKKFEKEITSTIRSLSLPHGEFRVQTEKEHAPFALHGLEKISFIIKTNPDQSLQAIAKVVSGGELSRLSLAIHLALAHRKTLSTLIFDEVDTGVGGATAEKIGKLLRKLGDHYQVFCVTHQAQVAACGHHHMLVEKYFVDNTTHTRLKLLNQSDKTQEIARMLGGETITQKTLDHAKEILALS